MPLIVLAEDNAELRELFAVGLEHLGFAVGLAVNGADLIELVAAIAGDAQRSRDLALIVTDVRMPGMDGISAIRSLRERGIATPVLFITAYGDAHSWVAAESLGGRWIEKPVGLNVLRAAVTEAVGVA
jgi:two-component system OmpR family response regulator